MRKKIEDYLSEDALSRLTAVQKRNILQAIKDQIPILFIGAPIGKTTLARTLRQKGIVAYAPEDVCTIALGDECEDGTKHLCYSGFNE